MTRSRDTLLAAPVGLAVVPASSAALLPADRSTHDDDAAVPGPGAPRAVRSPKPGHRCLGPQR